MYVSTLVVFALLCPCYSSPYDSFALLKTSHPAFATIITISGNHRERNPTKTIISKFFEGFKPGFLRSTAPCGGVAPPVIDDTWGCFLRSPAKEDREHRQEHVWLSKATWGNIIATRCRGGRPSGLVLETSGVPIHPS